jgi:hypothetical protein
MIGFGQWRSACTLRWNRCLATEILAACDGGVGRRRNGECSSPKSRGCSGQPAMIAPVLASRLEVYVAFGLELGYT